MSQSSLVYRVVARLTRVPTLGVVGFLIGASTASTQSPADTGAVLAAVGRSLVDVHPRLRGVGDRWRCERRADVDCDAWWSLFPATEPLQLLATSAGLPLRSVRGGPGSWPACPVQHSTAPLGSDVGYGAAAVAPTFRGDTAQVIVHLVCDGRTMRRDRFTLARETEGWIVLRRQHVGRRST
jgi:hypothetical protein